MVTTVELSSLNLRFEGHRLRDDAREARLLAEILERDIQEPLEGVDVPVPERDEPLRILLNGFKRYRCAKRLNRQTVPYVSLGADEAAGIVQLMRGAKNQSLSILEQAKFIDELTTIHGQSLADITQSLSRSKAWVSMRRGLLAELTPEIEAILFRGAFPVYSYLYTLRPFRRMNGEMKQRVERFIRALAGQKRSVREIESLAHGYFRGPDSMRQAIDEGKSNWALDQIQRIPDDPDGCSEFERQVLRDMEQLRIYLHRVVSKCDDPRLTHRAFLAEANLVSAQLLRECEPLLEKLRTFHDRTGQTNGHLSDASSRDVGAGN
jgi:hypothetical protein